MPKGARFHRTCWALLLLSQNRRVEQRPYALAKWHGILRGELAAKRGPQVVNANNLYAVEGIRMPKPGTGVKQASCRRERPTLSFLLASSWCQPTGVAKPNVDAGKEWGDDGD
ncbi:hypothetical protein B0H63DRAFT_448704 [Podospora didyma]|uniref:Secreted protein n=1 Tax=Podospora didyma TaxID=330526 RepID=A0AAE0NUE1_9PEZI|nr:hypothetical protein B0H63DRAFT_448704 [Podospora didyma]